MLCREGAGKRKKEREENCRIGGGGYYNAVHFARAEHPNKVTINHALRIPRARFRRSLSFILFTLVSRMIIVPTGYRIRLLYRYGHYTDSENDFDNRNWR